MRAREPDVEGYVERDGVKVGYEVFGAGEPTLLLLPTWTIVHSRFWKAQVPHLARRFRVVTFDGPGNGRSERTTDPAAYTVEADCEAALSVLDATGTGQAVVVSLSQGGGRALWLSAHRPERVLGSVYVGPAVGLGPQHPERAAAFAVWDEPYARPRAGRSTTDTTGSTTTRTSRGSSSGGASPSRTRRSRPRTASAGRSRRPLRP